MSKLINQSEKNQSLHYYNRVCRIVCTINQPSHSQISYICQLMNINNQLFSLYGKLLHQPVKELTVQPSNESSN